VDGRQRALQAQSGDDDTVADLGGVLVGRRRGDAFRLAGAEARDSLVEGPPGLHPRSTCIPRGDARPASLRRPAFGRPGQLGGLLLEVLDDAVDLAPRLAKLLVEPRFDATAECLLALPQAVLAGLHPGLGVAQHLPLPRRQPALVVEVVQVLVDARQVLGQLGVTGAQVLARRRQHLLAQSQPARDLERQAAPGRAVDEAVGRLEGGRVEAEGRDRDPGGRGRVGLQRLRVAGADDDGATRPEVIHQGHRQGASLGGVGARPELVEEHQCRQRQHPVHRHDVGDVPGEGAEVGVDRLLVADVGEHSPEHREPRPRGRGDVQASLRHQRQEAGRLQRDRLAAGVWPGDDEDGGGRRQQDVHRHRLGGHLAGVAAKAALPLLRLAVLALRAGQLLGDRPNQQGMAGRPQLETAVARDRRLDAAHQGREAGLGLDHVELGRGVQRPLQIERPAAEGIGERQQDAPDLRRFLLLQRHDLVVDVHRAEGLEVEARAARRAAVNDPGDGRPVLGADDQHVAAVAVGDDLVLQVAGGVAPPEVRLERAAQAGPLAAQAVTDRSQLGARVVGHLAARVDLLADLRCLGLERGSLLDQAPEQGEGPGGPANGSPRLFDGVEEIGQAEQPGRLERAPFDSQRGQGALDVGRRLQGERTAGGEIASALCRRSERLRDPARVGVRAKAGEALPPEGRGRLDAHRLDDSRELQGLLGGSLHRRVGDPAIRRQPPTLTQPGGARNARSPAATGD